MCKKVIQFLGIKMSNISWLKWAYSKIILRIHELLGATSLEPTSRLCFGSIWSLRQLWVLGLLLNYMTNQTYVPGRTMLGHCKCWQLPFSNDFVKQYKNSPLVRYCLKKEERTVCDYFVFTLTLIFRVSILCREILCLLTSVIC